MTKFFRSCSPLVLFFAVSSIAACSAASSNAPGSEIQPSDAGAADATSSPQGPSDPIFATLDGETTCLTGQEFAFGLPADATLSPGIDYLAGFALEPAGSTHLGPDRNPNAKISIGTACSTSTDVPTCMSALAADVTPETGWSAGDFYGTRAQVRMTKGNTVSVVRTSAEDVAALYLPIDTPREAMARVAGLRTYGSPTCKKSFRKDSDGSYLVRSEVHTCTSQTVRDARWDDTYFVLRVSPDGTTSVLKREDTHRTLAARCPES